MTLRFYYQGVNFINFFSSIYIAFLFFFFKKIETVSEIFFVISFISIFTQGFSANIRNIYLGSKEFSNFKKVVLIRILIGIIGLVISIFISNLFFIDKSSLIIIDSLIFLTVVNWILELINAKLEKEEKFNIYYSLNFLFFILLSPFFIYFKDSLLFPTFIICYSLINIYIFKKTFVEIVNQIFHLNKSIFKNIFFNIGIVSTLLRTAVNFFWKFFIIFSIGKQEATFVFIGFTIGSFFGTLFDICYGAYFLKSFKNKNLFINIFFISYIFAVLLFLFIVKTFLDFNSLQINSLLITTIFSVIGAFFMVQALRIRQLFFEESTLRLDCYKADIYIQILNFLIVPFLYYLNANYIVVSYLFSSIFFYLVYTSIKINDPNKKNIS